MSNTALVCVYHFIAPDVETVLANAGWRCERMGHYAEDNLTKVWQMPTREVLKLISQGPDLFFTLNGQHLDPDGRVSRLLNNKGIPHVVWFVDNPFNSINPWYMEQGYLQPSDLAHLWVIDREFIAPLNAMGFKHVSYVPHGFTPRFTAQGPTSEPAYPVSFIGNLGLPITEAFYRDALDADTESRVFAETVTSAYLDKGRTHFDTLTRAIAKDHPVANGFFGEAFEDRVRYDYLKFHTSVQYRLAVVSAAARSSELHIFGEEDWERALPAANRHPRAYYQTDTPRIYGDTRINLNVTHTQFPTAFNQRIMDVLAGGNFLLTDYSAALEDHFTPGKDIVCYDRPDAVGELIAYYTRHNDKRQAIAQRGQAIVAEHYNLETLVTRALDAVI